MAVIHGRKAVFFTLISILIVSTLLVAFTPRTYSTLKDKIPSTQARISTADDFVEVMKTAYIPMALITSGYNALNALSQYEKAKGALFSDYNELNAYFAEMMLNGTIKCDPPLGTGQHIPVEECLALPSGTVLMEGRNFTKRLADLEANSNQVGLPTKFSTTYSDYRINLFQNNDTGPFQVGVNISLNFSVNAEIAWWNLSESIPVIFGTSGIEDPLYSVQSQAAIGSTYTNAFNQSNLTSWNLTNLFLEAEWRKYVHDPEGRSFLSRFTQKDEASGCCGIASLINPFVMSNPNVGRIEKPYVDWCFFGTRCPVNTPGKLWNISCITESTQDDKFYRFSLDSAHALLYNVTDFVYETTDPNNAAQCNQLMQAVCSIDPDTTCN